MAEADLFSSLKTVRRSDSAVEQFLRLIRSGQLTPGTRLPSERELVSLLGVSRSSLREAVRVLETLGVLRVVAGSGTWVCDQAEGRAEGLSGRHWLATHEDDVWDLFEVRDVLEVQAARLAAERATDEDLEKLERTLDVIRQAVKAKDNPGMIAADLEFHIALAEASENEVLARAIADLLGRLEDVRLAMLSLPGRKRRMVAEHEAIVNAVRSRKPEAAARVLAKHVHRVDDEVRAAIESVKAETVASGR